MTLSDPWAAHLGVEILETGEGMCRAALRLSPHMVNAYGSPHGAVIFSLADIALGVACNTFGADVAFALTVTISYLSFVGADATLVAEARASKQGRVAGFYDVVVTTDTGTKVATVHAVAHRVGVR